MNPAMEKEDTLHQSQFVSFLKKKGTGPTMSKNLSSEELHQVTTLFRSPRVHLTTKATLISAFLTLQNSSEETVWLETVIRNPNSILPSELIPLLPNQTSNHPFVLLIKNVFTHHDLNEKECEEALRYFFDTDTPEYLKAAFLEAERLKRETELENRMFYDALWEKSRHGLAGLPVLIDLSNAYDGFNRTPYFTVFTAALLGSIGFPCVLHGSEDVGPKYGVTAFKVLKEAGKNPLRSIENTLSDLENPLIAWAYCDQRLSFPELDAIRTLRKNMVKRPILATLEKLLQPIRSPRGNYVVMGYTHPPYKGLLISLLKHQNRCPRFLILRGVEGSIQAALDRRTPFVNFNENAIEEGFIRPSDFQIPESALMFNHELITKDSLQLGLKALRGEKSPVLDSIIYQARIILHCFQLLSPDEAAFQVKHSIDSGKAYQHWERGMENTFIM